MIKLTKNLEDFLKKEEVYEKATFYAESSKPIRMEYKFLASMFDFRKTEEGFVYWSKISDKQ